MDTQLIDKLSYTTLLLDIEGTIAPIDFVYQTLFPYARQRVGYYLGQNWTTQGVRHDVDTLLQQYEVDRQQGLAPPPLKIDSIQPRDIEGYVCWLMDNDSKTPGLKSLQGRIWEFGYENGTLKSHFFEDVLPAFLRWKKLNKPIYIFSSGSVLAQKLFFKYSQHGDLSKYICGYFDTTIGSKKELESYLSIAAEINENISNILFISDLVAELEAAHSANMKTLLSARPGNSAQKGATFMTIKSFDSL